MAKLSKIDAKDEGLIFTGERYQPEIGGDVQLEHLHRYAFAKSLVHNKTVLDIACGEGYGSALLSETAKYVTGVDIESRACLLYTSPSPRDRQKSRMPSSA